MNEDYRLHDAAVAQTLRYSNFLITLSSNVHPENDDERTALADWFVDQTNALFGDWDRFNGTVIKPAGTPNSEMHAFPDDHLIISVQSAVGIEEGDFNGRNGQIHCHVLLEVAHRYTSQRDGAEGFGSDHPDRRNLGVHTNVRAMRDFLNGNIHNMQIDEDRRPQKIYVNSRLLTKGTDNSNKWLTYQYINKQAGSMKDNPGLPNRNVAVDRANARPELLRARQALLHPQPIYPRPQHHNLEEAEIGGAGGALDDDDVFGYRPSQLPTQLPLSQVETQMPEEEGSFDLAPPPRRRGGPPNYRN